MSVTKKGRKDKSAEIMPDFGLPYAFSLYTNATDTVDERSAGICADCTVRHKE